MFFQSACLFCLAYIVGLWLTGIPYGGAIVFLLSLGVEWAITRWRPMLLPRKICAIAGLIALCATLYHPFRIPQPGKFDISHYVPETPVLLSVRGTVLELPHLSRNDRMQVWFQPETLLPPDKQVLPLPADRVTGRLYVTLPQAFAADLYPGEKITVQGKLYRPQGLSNPGGFDFKTYLAEQGCFAGLQGEAVEILPDQTPSWGLWQIQRRIVRSQAHWLLSPEGELISAMVLGSKAVDLPVDLKQQFSRIGLCHALAASGFQTSLILGVVLALTQRFPQRFQILCGGLSLLLFLGLAGAQPAVLRAVIMGFAGLIGLALERKIHPLGSLLVAATGLLLWNPLWISDLGFELSMLATLGLLVTAKPLSDWLDRLPSPIASAIAVPLAAYLWTIPLQLNAFGVVSPYSIPANLITTPLISLLSLGGMVSALAALVHPLLGSWTALGLHYPTIALLKVVEFFCQLPGNSIALGTLPLGWMLLLYGLLVLVTWHSGVRRYGWGVAIGAITLVLVWQLHQSTLQVTALVTAPQPVVVVQSQGKTLLINSGDTKTVEMTLLPFLQQQGINRIDAEITLMSPNLEGLAALCDQIPITQVYSLIGLDTGLQAQLQQRGIPLETMKADQISRLGNLQWQIIAGGATLQMGRQSWMFWTQGEVDKLPQDGILWWSGRNLKIRQPQLRKLKGAIAYGRRVHPNLTQALHRQKVPFYWLDQSGAVRWTPEQGFIPTRDLGEAETARL